MIERLGERGRRALMYLLLAYIGVLRLVGLIACGISWFWRSQPEARMALMIALATVAWVMFQPMFAPFSGKLIDELQEWAASEMGPALVVATWVQHAPPSLRGARACWLLVAYGTAAGSAGNAVTWIVNGGTVGDDPQFTSRWLITVGAYGVLVWAAYAARWALDPVSRSVAADQMLSKIRAKSNTSAG